MIVTKKAIPRRTILRGLGAAMALPLLDGMVPAFTALAQTAGAAVKRFGVVYVPNGVIIDKWTPAAEGAGFEFSPILKPLEPFRDRLLVRVRAHPERRRVRPRRAARCTDAARRSSSPARSRGRSARKATISTPTSRSTR